MVEAKRNSSHLQLVTNTQASIEKGPFLGEIPLTNGTAQLVDNSRLVLQQLPGSGAVMVTLNSRAVKG